MLKRLILLTLLITLATPLSAALYTWRDGNGITNVSDQPPTGQADVNVTEVKKIEILELETVNTRRLPHSPIDLAQYPEVEQTEPPPPPPVVLYTTEWCVICKQAKEYMAQKEIPFDEKDIEKSLVALKEFRQLDGNGVPLILLGDRVMAGFAQAEFDAFYEQ